MTLHKETFTEAELYAGAWEYVRKFKCSECGEEISVHQNRKTNKWLFLTSEMIAHDPGCGRET